MALGSSSARRRRTVSHDTPSCAVSLTIAPARRSSLLHLRTFGGVEQVVATGNAMSLQGAPGCVSSPSRQLQTTLHEAPFGPVHCRPADRDAARDHFVADAGVGGQQDLRAFKLTCRVLAPAQ
jgi:hypothetical protein